MHDIEREIIKATAFKARSKYADRQDYLKSLLNAANKLTDDDFGQLSLEASAWVNKAIEALNSKDDEVPDFDEITDEDLDDPEDEPSDNEEESDDGPDDEDSEDQDDETVEDNQAEADDTDDADEDAPEDEDDEETETDDTEAVDEEKPAKSAKEKKPLLRRFNAKGKRMKTIVPSRKKAAKAPVVKVVKTKAVPKKPRAVPDDVTLDKWGAMEGSKNSKALAMFEKGATTKEVKDALGGTYYNILSRVAKHGHRVEKEGSLIKITHLDDLNKVASKKGKK